MARGRRGMPGGMPGGAGGMDMGAMLKQVQQMQADMAKAQEELKDEIVEASAGGGMIKVTMSGDLELRTVEIDPEGVDPEDVEMLQDMVLAAVNEALRAAQERASSKLGDAGGGLGGLGLPGM
jgi:DNA-binding YbaB/EbfC family protein